jgi:hypothetical protein
MNIKHELNKFQFITKPITTQNRLNELGSLLDVAIRRLLKREREKQDQKSLDSSLKASVTAVYH